MTQLEKALGDGFYARIRPSGIDYSNFSYPMLKGRVYNGLLEDFAQFGVLLEDSDGKATELLGVLRNFHWKAELKKPIKLPAGIYDSGVNLSEGLYTQMAKFFSDLGEMCLPSNEFTTVYVGKFRTVKITEKFQENQWWNHMFLDLYTESDGLAEKLVSMDKRSRQVLNDSDKWARYGKAQKYGETRQEHGLGELGPSNIPLMLQYSTASMRQPLIRSQEDYINFLLGFSHAGYDIAMLHNNAMDYFSQQRNLEGLISQFNSDVFEKAPNIGRNTASMAKQHRVFGQYVNANELEAAYKIVDQDGKGMKGPITVSEDLWKLGFLVLRRNRQVQPTKNSYALIKIKGRKPGIQLKLGEGEPGKEIEVERQ
jgi:hypothetical protein